MIYMSAAAVRAGLCRTDDYVNEQARRRRAKKLLFLFFSTRNRQNVKKS